MRLSSFTFVASLAFVTACGGDAADDPAPGAASGGTSAQGGGAQGGMTSGAGGDVAVAEPTFHGTVESIMQKRCQSCHHDGGIAPFQLTTYEGAKAYGGLIKKVTAERTMPPWGADDTADCKPKLPFVGDMRLTDDEIATIGKWVDGGAPEGDPAKAPAPAQFSDQALPGVTHELSLPLEYTVKASTSDELECFVIDPNITETTFINGLAVLPGNPLVVHHVLVFKDTKREGLKLADGDGKYTCFGGSGVGSASLFAAWAPGVPAADFGPDTALELEKDSVFIVQVHYHPLQTDDQKDRTRVQLRAHDGTPKYVARTRLLGNSSSPNGALRLLPGPNDEGGVEFRIPANTSDHTETMEYTVPSSYRDVRLASVGTHMHWVGKNMKIEVLKAGATSEAENECLLATPRYDFNWQRGYVYDAKSFDELPSLSPGDTIRLTCTYDNTMQNKSVVKALSEQHMTSPVDVLLGESTLEEMCLGAFTMVEPTDPGMGAGGGTGAGGAAALPCDIGEIPGDLPQVESKFVKLDMAAGVTPPATTGGDPAGIWYVDHITTYLNPTVAGFVDLDASKTSGIGFFELRADGTYRQTTQFVSMLVTGAAGTLEQPSNLSSEGTYAVNGANIDFSAMCPKDGMATQGFTVEGDKLTLVSEQTLKMGGKINIVLEATRHTP